MSSLPQKNSFSIFGQADEYFEQNVLPKDIKGYTRVIARPTPYNHSHDTNYVFVRSGSGLLTVNGLDYKLKPNTITCLAPFHRYRYTPDAGQTLELVECRINSGAYVYLISNPYYKIKRFEVPSTPPVVYLRGFMKEVAIQAVDGILEESAQTRPDSTGLLFCYITDIAGVLYDGISSGRAAKPLNDVK